MKEFTLPVWVVAAAKSATKSLLGKNFCDKENVDLLNHEKSFAVPISSSALLESGQKALSKTYCQSGLALDITRGLEIWTYVQFQPRSAIKAGEEGFPDWLDFIGGEGLGKFEKTRKTS